jgi:glycosyltransferase involved in cell wall biosynthesis
MTSVASVKDDPYSIEPFISIVTVSLNAASSIEDTIASVFAQRIGLPVEHICVDGGSMDATRTIIDKWAQGSKRIVRIYERDTGIFDAMNKGLRAARGEYVLFLNADDFLASADTLARAAAGLSPGAAENPDLILGDVAMGALGRVGVWRHRRVPRLLGRLRGFGLYPLHQGQFTKRRLLNAVGGFNSALRFSSDLIQYYDMERMFRPTLRFLDCDVAFMHPGGMANAGLKNIHLATREFYRQLTLTWSRPRAAAMVLVKTLQSLAELRLGRCPHSRWFAAAIHQPPDR